MADETKPAEASEEDKPSAQAAGAEGAEGQDGEDEQRKDVERRFRRIRRKKRCRFDSPDEVDYKDIATLQKLITAQGKIMSRKRTGNDSPCQRATKQAIKRARFLALLPYTQR